MSRHAGDNGLKSKAEQQPASSFSSKDSRAKRSSCPAQSTHSCPFTAFLARLHRSTHPLGPEYAPGEGTLCPWGGYSELPPAPMLAGSALAAPLREDFLDSELTAQQSSSGGPFRSPLSSAQRGNTDTASPATRLLSPVSVFSSVQDISCFLPHYHLTCPCPSHFQPSGGQSERRAGPLEHLTAEPSTATVLLCIPMPRHAGHVH